MNVFDVHLVASDFPGEVHEAKCGDDLVVEEFVTFRQFSDTDEQFQEHINRGKEFQHSRPKIFINNGGLEKLAELLDKERSRNVVSLMLGDEEFVELIDYFGFYLREITRSLVFRQNHTVDYLNSIGPELVVMTEA